MHTRWDGRRSAGHWCCRVYLWARPQKSVLKSRLTSHASMSKLQSWWPTSWFQKPTDKNVEHGKDNQGRPTLNLQERKNNVLIVGTEP